jgi:hypothetical protein
MTSGEKRVGTWCGTVRDNRYGLGGDFSYPVLVADERRSTPIRKTSVGQVLVAAAGRM